jgi:hypothetical protein
MTIAGTTATMNRTQATKCEGLVIRRGSTRASTTTSEIAKAYASASGGRYAYCRYAKNGAICCAYVWCSTAT